VRAAFAAAVVLLLLTVSLGFARRRQRLGAALVTIVLAAAALWVVALVAVTTDYHDADGATDCWPNCTLLQDSVAVAFFWIPAVVAAIVIFAGLMSVVGRISTPRESSR
jgi:hypothetical protein